jgi:hypothetical protein
MRANLELHISFAHLQIKGCLQFPVVIPSLQSLSFACSSAITITSVSANGFACFFRRSLPSTSDNTTGLRVYLPDLKPFGLWSPVPHFVSRERSINLVIFYEIEARSPSVLHFPNFMASTTSAYGVAGWVPILLSCFDGFSRFSIRVDHPEYQILGPGVPVSFSPGRASFDLSRVPNVDTMAWAIGNFAAINIFDFRFLSICPFASEHFSFLEFLRPLVSVPEVPPIIVIPHHSVQLEVSDGFCLLSADLFVNYCDFPCFVSIPTRYHVLAAISHALSFYRFGRRFSVAAGDCEWFLHGLIGYCSSLFFKAGAGDAASFYEWVLLRYLWKYSENVSGTLSNPKSFHLVRVSQWCLRQSLQVRAQFVVRAMANFVAESCQEPEQFHAIWPDRLKMSILLSEFGRYVDNPERFLQFWLNHSIVPVIDIVIASKPLHFRAETKTTVGIWPSTKTRRPSEQVKFPIVVRIVHALGSLAQVVLLPQPLDGNRSVKPSTRAVFVLPVFRPNSRTVFSGDAQVFKSLLFVLVQTVPRIPLIVTYAVPSVYLFNIVRCRPSIFAMHEALSSLHRILRTTGDDGGNTIIDFLSRVMADGCVFFSVRCHAIHILTRILEDEMHAPEARVAKQSLVAFFFREIADERTAQLKQIDRFHPSIVLSIFQAIATCSTISENFSVLDQFRFAIQMFDETEIGPGLLLCLNHDQFWSGDATISATNDLIQTYAALGHNPPMMRAAIKVFNRAPSTFPQFSAEKTSVFLVRQFNDPLIHVETRIALLEAFVMNYGYEGYVTLLSGITAELARQHPDYYFIERALRIGTLLKNEHSETTYRANLRSGLRKMYDYIHPFIIAVTGAHFSLLEIAVALFEDIFQEKWAFRGMPDGLISSHPMPSAINQPIAMPDLE